MFSPRLRSYKNGLNILAVMLVVLCGSTSSAFAQGSITAIWIGPGGGAWSDPNNWNCVTSTGNTFHCVPDSLTNPGSTFTVNIDNTQALLDITAEVDGVTMGVLQSDFPGSLSVGGTTLTVDSELDAGVLIPGNLSITSGGIVNDSTATIAVGTGSAGSSVAVSGANSQWNTTGELDVGFKDAGTLTVQSGGLVTSGSGGTTGCGTNSFIGGGCRPEGAPTTGVGTAMVTGAGSKWNVAGDLFVGWPGRGNLTVSSGGQVNSVQGVISNSLGAVGTATVTGKGSQWNTSQLLYVGSANGNGTLTVSNGGVVNDPQSIVGIGPLTNSVSVGTATVTGAGSQWNTSSGFGIGFGQGTNGTLTVQSGGTGNVSGVLSIGLTGGTGTLNLMGSGTSWNSTTQQVQVGTSGDGTLNVKNGAVLSSVKGSSPSGTSGIVGLGSPGTALVSGAGSQWNQDGGMRVGFNSSGTLTVSGGGAVSDAAGSIGFQTGSNGTATVTGSGSVWNNTNSLDVGIGAPGTLTIGSGGLVIVGTNANPGAVTIGSNGNVKVSVGGAFSLRGAGSYTQTGGTTTIDGMLVTSSVSAAFGGSIFLTGTGSVNINGGSVFGNGGSIVANVTSSGAITPADTPTSIGTLAVGSSYSQTGNGTLNINVANPNKFNQLNVSNSASLNGTLNIVLLPGFVPKIGSTFPILTAGSVAGAFSTVNGTSINSSEHFVVQYNSNNVTLQVVAGAS